MPATDWRYLVLFDGDCGLCSRSVQWLLRHDRREVLRYAPLQGETARPFVADPERIETMVFVEKLDDGRERVHVRSRAVLQIVRHLGGAWRLVSWLRFLPAFLTDLPYRVIAKNRIRWSGRADACRLPDAHDRQQFLP